MTKEQFMDVVMLAEVRDEDVGCPQMEGDNLLCQTLKGKFTRRKLGQ